MGGLPRIVSLTDQPKSPLVRTDNLSKLTGQPAEVASLPVTGSYPRNVLTREVVKGGVGIAICLGIVLLLNPSTWLAVPLTGIAGLFGLYVWQQARRFSLRLEMDETGVIRVRGENRTAFHWSDLRDFRLNFYAHGRKSSQGTLVIVLKCGSNASPGKPGKTVKPAKLKVDSSLDHFPTLLLNAAGAARKSSLELHPTTLANLDQFEL